VQATSLRVQSRQAGSLRYDEMNVPTKDGQRRRTVRYWEAPAPRGIWEWWMYSTPAVGSCVLPPAG